MRIAALRLVGTLLIALALSCSQGAPPPPAASEAIGSGRARPAPTSDERRAVHDLSVDESLGGHTLARHVGKTDDELRERLRREPQISSASTYTDRAAAERAVGAALASSGGRLTAWHQRRGRRPNLVLHYAEHDGQALGRSLSRGQQEAVPSHRALVVLRWDERAARFYVLTSYPEADR